LTASAEVERPDTLVLGVGGVLGEAWMSGVLAGMSARSGIDFRDCEHVVGTSAGSIVGAYLIAGEPLREPGDVGDDGPPAPPPVKASALGGSLLRRAGTVGLAAGAPLAPLALNATARAGALARAALLSWSPRGSLDLNGLGARLDRLGARFDGRLRVVAVDRARGRRVVFGDPDAPQARVGEAVEASCAVPGLFRPVTIQGRAYVDGGAWSPTNLDVSPARRGMQVLCLTPTGRVAAVRSPTFAWRAMSRSATMLELAALKRRGATVSVIAPDDDSARAMGENLMDHVPRDRVLAAGYRQGLLVGG
jgi:NTE family protein